MRSIRAVEGPRHFYPMILPGGEGIVARGRLAAFLSERTRHDDTLTLGLCHRGPSTQAQRGPMWKRKRLVRLRSG